MKKILAFVLASIMVLSLVPASAFAAITKDCPDTHTLDNCEWTFVETVKPTCNKDDTKGFGYTVYECNACGEQFLANFVEPLAHTWENDPDGKKQTLNCNKKEDGIKSVKCSVCGKTEEQVTPWNQGHTPKYVTGFGCEALYECTTCGLEFYGLDKNNEPKLDAGHEWEFTKVEVEPVIKNGVVTPGSALYTCKGCKDTKSVQIVSPACKCDQGHQDVFTTRIVDYKANACGVEGTYAVYKCDDCNQLYKADKNGKILGKINNIEEAKLPAKEHEAKADTTKKGNYDCEYTFTCKHCNKKITGYHHEKEKSYMVVTEYSVRDCVNYGYSVWLCNLCGWNEAIFEDPTGHKQVNVTVDSTCATYGYTYTYCANEWCTLKEYGTMADGNPFYQSNIPYDVAVDGKPVKLISLVRHKTLDDNAHDVILVAKQEVSCVQNGLEVYKCKFCNKMTYKTIPALTHSFDEEKTEYVAPSCTTPGYIQKYCKNCNQLITVATIPATPGVCSYESVKKGHSCIQTTSESYVDKYGKRYHGYEIFQCTGCEKTLTVYSDLYPTAPQTWFANKTEAELYHYGEADLVNGEWVYKYTDNLVKQEALCVASTCYSNGYDVYKCNKCNTLVYVTAEKLPHTNFKTTGEKASTCSAVGNTEYSKCNVCTALFIYVDAKGEQVTNLYKDSDNKTQQRDHNYMAANGYKQVEIVIADTVINAHASLLTEDTKVTVADCTGKILYTYYKCPGKNCGKTFTDNTASTIYTGPKSEITHKYTTIVEYSAATCEKDDVVGIYFCEACETYKLKYDSISYNVSFTIIDGVMYFTPNSYKIETHEDDELSLEDVETKVFDNSDETIEIYIGTDGVRKANTVSNCRKFEHGYVDKTQIQNIAPGEWWLAITTTHVGRDDCSTVEYDHNICKICNYEYLDNYKPASSKDGHVNKFGDKIPTDCATLQTLSEIKRTCYFCGETVEAEHTLLDSKPIHVDGTCTVDGYDYNYCVDCGHKDVVKVYWADPEAYHTAKDEDGILLNAKKVGVTEDYAHAGDYYYACNECGKKLTETEKVPCPGTGLEIYAKSSTDKCIPGSTIYITISLDSFKGVEVWGINFPVAYNPEVLSYVGYEFNTGSSSFQNFVVTDVLVDEVKRDPSTNMPFKTGKKVSDGIVNIAVNNEEGVTIKGAENLVTLEFKVIGTDPYATNFIRIGDVYSYRNCNAYSVDAVDTHRDTVDAIYNGVNEIIIALKAFLNVDGDKEDLVTMSDALALYELIVFDEYDVVADADCDGKVTMADLTILYNILTGKITVDEFVNPVVEEESTGTGTAPGIEPRA